MDNVRIESFDLNGDQIKTTVIDIMDKKIVDEEISALLRSASQNPTKIIGFDIQFIFDDKDSMLNGQYDCYGYICESSCAFLNFCIGNLCLIVRLTSSSLLQNHSNHFNSLLNLLSLPDYTFVGVGMKHNCAKLEQQYGIGRMHAVEIGPLAANLMNKPRLSYCGVDELAFVVSNLDLRKHRPVSMDFDWGSDPLSNELVKLATVNVYSYYKIGSTLLGWDASIPPESCIDD